MSEQPKDAWDKLQAIGTLASGVLIPLVIAITGHYVTQRMKESENELKYIEIATSLIREEPRDENVALRDWAIENLAAYSKTVPLTIEAQRELKKRRVPVYAGGWETASYGAFTSSVTSPTKKEPKK